jgi:tetratricopeptide (TPR) repeat protein
LERGGDDLGASNAFDRAARLAPRDPRPRVQRAILDAKAGRLDAALAEVDAVLADAPDDGEAHLVRGKVLLARGEKQRALLALRRACDLLPLSYEAHYNAGALALELEGPASALPDLVRAYENRPPSDPGTAIADVVRATGIAGPGAYVQLATADADRGQRDSALAWIDLALARDANHGPAHFLRGGMKFEKGDREGARASWARAVERMPDSFPAREALAGVLLELGDREGALREYREAVRILEKAGADPGQIEVVRARVRDLEAKDADGR